MSEQNEHSSEVSTPRQAFPRELRIIERTGQIILTTWFITMVVLGVVLKEPYSGVWQLVLGQVAMGRALSVSTGISMGFSRWFLLVQCSLQDIIILLLVYPFAVAGYRRAVEMSFIGRTIMNIRATAERHRDRLGPWGFVGLVSFVLFPFWGTGALAGGILGYLIGLRTWVTFSSVIIGNFIAVALWIFLFDQMRAFSETMSNHAPLVIMLIMGGIGLIVYLRKRRKRLKAEEEETTETAETSATEAASIPTAECTATDSSTTPSTARAETPAPDAQRAPDATPPDTD